MATQSRSIRTRKRVLEAAGAEFLNRRFEAATIKGIADRARLTTGAVMFHFASKEAIAAEIIRVEEALAEALRTMYPRPLSTDELLISQLFAMLRNWAGLIRSSPIVGGAIRLIVERPEFVEDEYESWGVWVTKIRTMLDASRRRGELRSRVPLDEWAAYIAESFTGVQVVSAAATGHSDFLERFDRAWRLTAPALISRARLKLFEFDLASLQNALTSPQATLDFEPLVESLVADTPAH